MINIILFNKIVIKEALGRKTGTFLTL